MDRTTTHDGVLNYTAEFNPSIVPHKRMAVFDLVGEGYTLKVSDGTLAEVKLTPQSSPPGRDPFWASLVLKVRAGEAVPIPSVAPRARVLSYRTTPRAKVQFFRDGADNHWVKAAHTGQVRLIFLTDAPRSYFSPSVPAGVTAADTPLPLRPRLPASARAAAEKVLRRLRLSRNAPLKKQLNRLAAYFRSFRAGKLPDKSSGDTYLDIALGQLGVCRHRAFAFVITAQALGIPARYVQNEAHAFSEVYVPRLGWVRMDLGGASSELRVHNGRRRTVYRPGPDPFPTPSSYAAQRNGTPQTARITGLGRGQRKRLRSGRRMRHLRGAESSEGKGKGGAAAARDQPVGAAGRPTSGSVSSPPTTPTASAEAPPPRLATMIKLTSPGAVVSVVDRGSALTVKGHVRHGSSGVEGLQVDLLLSRDGRVGYPVGSLVTDQKGHFRGQLPVPRDVEVGTYRVYAETPGDSKYAGSRSQ